MNPRFQPGRPVRVRVAWPLGHVRTPHYVRGKEGVVERILGEFRNPEELAYGRSGEPRLVLYRIRFAQRHIWPDYAEGQDDTVDVEIYEHWLEPV